METLVLLSVVTGHWSLSPSAINIKAGLLTRPLSATRIPDSEPFLSVVTIRDTSSGVPEPLLSVIFIYALLYYIVGTKVPGTFKSYRYQYATRLEVYVTNPYF
jgi:hypothetical protein